MRIWLCLLWLGFGVPAAAVLVDGVAAVVDGRVITRSEVEEAASLGKRTGTLSGQEPLQEALQTLIDRALVAGEAERLAVQVSDAEVERAIAEIRARNSLSADEFRGALASQGIDFEAYRQEVRAQVQRAKLAGRVLQSRLQVGDEALREYYLRHVAQFREPDTVRLHHILVAAADGRELAEALRLRVLAGESFAALARQHSAAPTAAAGGEMGSLALQDLAAPVRAAVRDLGAGGVSSVLEMGGAYHLFWVAERSAGRVRSFEEVRDEVRDRYFEDREEELYRTWIESLREKAAIEVKL